MADHLVVIGRGRLISTGPVADFVSASTTSSVVVGSPDLADLADLVGLLEAAGAVVEAVEPGTVQLTGLTAAEVGDLAFEHRVRLHELATRVATLEEAFLEATAQDEEYRAGGAA